MQVLIVFLFLFIFMAITMPRFLSPINLNNLLRQNAVALIIGAGMTGVLICGELDISVGAVLALAGVSAGLVSSAGMAASIAISLAIGLCFGLVNGIITTKGKVPSFIVTLGTQMMARSLGYVLTRGQVMSHYPEGWRVIGQGVIFGGFPLLFVVVIVVYGLTFTMLRKTRFGQHVYAVGSNRSAAILSGINADTIKIKAMVFCGLMAGLGGILLSSRVMAIQADTATGMEFDVIAGVIIGGTSLSGGSGNILQSVIGIFIIGMIRNALNLSHIDIYWKDFVTGAVIVTAVLLDSLRRYLQNKLTA
jgi:ribose/xylose/arabinose/galactoside ABC-type transport system permease subunit